jgi:hypothetical protein
LDNSDRNHGAPVQNCGVLSGSRALFAVTKSQKVNSMYETITAKQTESRTNQVELDSLAEYILPKEMVPYAVAANSAQAKDSLPNVDLVEPVAKAVDGPKPGSLLSISNLIENNRLTENGQLTEQVKNEVSQFLHGNTWFERNIQSYESRTWELYNAMERERVANPERPLFSPTFEHGFTRLDGRVVPNRVRLQIGGTVHRFDLR